MDSTEDLKQSLTVDRSKYLVKRVDSPLGEVEVDSVLQRYENGESILDIAHSLGVSDVAVYRAMVRNAPELWKEYQAATALAQLQAAEDGLRAASDAVSVTRAAHDVRAQQWKLERVLRRLYGDDKAQAPAVAVSIVMDFSQSPEQALTDVSEPTLGK